MHWETLAHTLGQEKYMRFRCTWVGATRKWVTLRMMCAPNRTYSHRGSSASEKLEARDETCPDLSWLAETGSRWQKPPEAQGRAGCRWGWEEDAGGYGGDVAGHRGLGKSLQIFALLGTDTPPAPTEGTIRLDLVLLVFPFTHCHLAWSPSHLSTQGF